MTGLAPITLASTAFVGSHLLMSHPWRAPLVRALGGEGAFAGLYSVVAAVTLGLTVWGWRVAGTAPPLWPVGDGLWAAATVLTLGASVLFVGSLRGNPALVSPGGAAAAPAEARGVYAVTRHPMMWSFALWAASHALVFPVGRNLVLTAAIAALALGGAAGQDRKKAAGQPATWPGWQARTSFVPFAAVARGRARLGGTGAAVPVAGVLLWLAASWAHGPIAGWPAGVWRWIGG